MTVNNQMQTNQQSSTFDSNVSSTDVKIGNILNLDSYCKLRIEQFRNDFTKADQEHRQVLDTIVKSVSNSLTNDIKSMAKIEHKIISYWWEQSNIEIRANNTKDTQSNQNYYYQNNRIPQNQKIQKGENTDLYSIISLYNIMNSEFPQFVELVRIKTYSINKMKEFITIPNDQEKRLYHINQGDKYLQSALYGADDNELYTDALSEYTKALNYESKDYYSLNKCGYIYLKSDKNKDYPKAENSFRSAAKYLIAEARAKESDNKNQEELLSEAAYSLLYAAESCSLQGKKSEAIKLAVDAWKCRMDYTQAGLFLAKCILDSNVMDSVLFIDNLINENKYFGIKILLDKELISRKEIQQSILSKKDELLKSISKQINEIEQHIIENSQAKDKFNRAKELYKFNTYLQLREVLDILEEKCEWIIPMAVNYNTNGNITAEITNEVFKGTMLEYIKQERLNVEEINRLNILTTYQNMQIKIDSYRTRIFQLQTNINEYNDRHQNNVGDIFWKNICKNGMLLKNISFVQGIIEFVIMGMLGLVILIGIVLILSKYALETRGEGLLPIADIEYFMLVEFIFIISIIVFWLLLRFINIPFDYAQKEKINIEQTIELKKIEEELRMNLIEISDYYKLHFQKEGDSNNN